MRVWIQFKKSRDLRFLSHLDLMRAWQRAVRRARLPIAYSAGFNPHPKISFASALAVGIASDAEYLDIIFTTPLTNDDFARLAATSPVGLKMVARREVPESVPPLMSLIRAARWLLPLDNEDLPALQERIEEILKATTLPVERKGKKGTKTVDIRPFIHDLTLDQQQAQLHMLLASGGDGGVKPREVMALLHLNTPEDKLHRAELYLGIGEKLQTPMAVLLNQKEVSINAEKDSYQL
jgi:radical SAM-linked protein